jgi:cell division protein ZapB
MISDFELLSQKVGELAELAHAMRRENATLRAQIVGLDAQNGSLAARMAQAHERVSSLLNQLPAPIDPASPSDEPAVESETSHEDGILKEAQ